MRLFLVFLIAIAGCASRPAVQPLAGYRSVLIEPARVELAERGYKHTQEVHRFAGEVAASLESSLADAMRARGFEIATAPGPGVLRLSPAVSELYVNAPEQPTPWRTRTFTRNAGDARLSLEARDAVSGALLARVDEKAVAEQMGRVALANEVTTRFWFDALFRRWAASRAAELSAARDRSS
jgi:Protein of unknown function (DUF3313)